MSARGSSAAPTRARGTPRRSPGRTARPTRLDLGGRVPPAAARAGTAGRSSSRRACRRPRRSARRAGSPRRSAVRVAGAVPALVVGAHDVHALARRNATPASICSPSTVCVCIRRRSSGERPGLRRISSGMPILPTSWSRKPASTPGLRASRVDRATPARSRSAARAPNGRGCRCPSTRARSRAPRPSRGTPLEQPPLAALDLEQARAGRGRRAAAAPRRRRRRARGTGSRRDLRDVLDHGEQLQRAEGLGQERVGAAPLRRGPKRRRPRRRSGGSRRCRSCARRAFSSRQSSIPSMPGMCDVEHDHVGEPRRDRSRACLAPPASTPRRRRSRASCGAARGIPGRRRREAASSDSPRNDRCRDRPKPARA